MLMEIKMAGNDTVYLIAFAVAIDFTAGWVTGLAQIYDCTLFVECRNPAGDSVSGWWLPTILSLMVSGCAGALALACAGMRFAEMVSLAASDAAGE